LFPADTDLLNAGSFLDAFTFFPVHSASARRAGSLAVRIRYELTSASGNETSCLQNAWEGIQLLAGSAVDSNGPEHGGNAAGRAQGKQADKTNQNNSSYSHISPL